MVSTTGQKVINVKVDVQLLTEAKVLGEHRTKEETVTQALEEFIRKRKQIRVLELFGKVDFDLTYDYKKQRNKS